MFDINTFLFPFIRVSRETEFKVHGFPLENQEYKMIVDITLIPIEDNERDNM